MAVRNKAREMRLIAALFVLNCLLKTTTTSPATSAYSRGDALAWRPATSLLDQLRHLGVRALIRDDAEATALASADFGNVSDAQPPPAAVLYPSLPEDIAKLLRASCTHPSPFPVSARGCGHSTRGQASAPRGVVVDMMSLGCHAGGSSIRLSVSVDGRYVDAGSPGARPHPVVVDRLPAPHRRRHPLQRGNQRPGLPPRPPNIQRPRTRRLGEMVTCSKDKHADLFDAVLGGLGQFGVITRARIPLMPAPARARWVRLFYTSAAALTADQEGLIGINLGTAVSGLMDYVEGSVVLADQGRAGSWRSSFFSDADAARIAALAEEAGGILYCLEGALYYGGAAAARGGESDVDQRLDVLLRELRYARGFAFVQDVSYAGFLDRVRDGELKLRAAGLWDVPHPWLNLFLPRSRVLDFAVGVFHGILRRDSTTGAMGPVLVYPMNRNRWDPDTSAVFPDEEEVFYTVGILRSSVPASTDDGRQLLRRLEEQNEEILRFCEEMGIPCVQYLPYYGDQEGWEKKHFGPAKWARFVERKRKYDPKAILSRGQRIFTSPLA
uniref:Cytokinin oxidase/dehydrogenase n=2 Tax=Hordeum vulgare subsp. vulgare TaxID=112509 RepID=I3VIW2_HORVV|nr:cytokinin oxidase/dehydrogenase [Hordeum vulgare subsp. vulgare]